MPLAYIYIWVSAIQLLALSTSTVFELYSHCMMQPKQPVFGLFYGQVRITFNPHEIKIDTVQGPVSILGAMKNTFSLVSSTSMPKLPQEV